MPNFSEYHETVTAELDAIKNRIRNLVTHWLTDGEWKEAALRAVLRRHLPGGTQVGRGFIVGREDSSTQIDLFVLRPDKPTLFRDGELAIVTPDVPGALAEVKTNLEGEAAWYKAADNLQRSRPFHSRASISDFWIFQNESIIGCHSYGTAWKNKNNKRKARNKTRKENI